MTTKPANRVRINSTYVLCAVLLVLLLVQHQLASILNVPAIATGATVFVAVCAQALPFLVLGVLLSAALAAFVPADLIQRILPKHPIAAVPVAGLAGVCLPGCECASAPVARRLMYQGVKPAVALTFLLAAPSVNPVVIVATSVAFPKNQDMVVARFVASLVASCVVGWLWALFGDSKSLVARLDKNAKPDHAQGKFAVFIETARGDLLDAGGFLVLGALIAATISVVLPQSWTSTVGANVVLAIVIMALLAIVMSLCSEADAFVVASFAAVPLTAKLVFLVVGPAVDLKLIGLYSGTFGRQFAAKFVPLALASALVSAVVVGGIVLGWK